MLAAAATLLPAAWARQAAAADPTAPGAADALARECALAAAEGKGVLVEFYASWCVWCEPMDLLLNDAAMASILRPRFRTLRMRVWERRGVERARQLAGADDVFARYAPAASGLPFLTFLDGAGQTLTSSLCPATNENIGYPVAAAELDWLESMLATVAPESTESERDAARAACIRLYRSR
jgi:thiol:disulfide interchange protein